MMARQAFRRRECRSRRAPSAGYTRQRRRRRSQQFFAFHRMGSHA